MRNLTYSLVICTYKRPNILKRTLEALLAHANIESLDCILVVDNACQLETKSVVSTLASGAQVELCYRQEPEKGVVHARNTGWQHVESDVVIYLDDDCTPSAGWLSSLRAHVAEHFESLGICGGRVLLAFPGALPAWLHPALKTYYSGLDLGDDAMALGHGQAWLPEGNCAISRQALQAVGGFSKNLGHRGGNMLSHEGNELRIRLEAEGRTCYYLPKMEVTHLIHEKRVQEKRWLYKRVYMGGYSEGLVDRAAGEEGDAQRKQIRNKQFKSLFHPSSLLSLCKGNLQEKTKKRCDWLFRYGYARALLGHE